MVFPTKFMNPKVRFNGMKNVIFAPCYWSTITSVMYHIKPKVHSHP